MRLTILFDAPYWIGLLEWEEAGLLYAARHIFGAEPSDQEIYHFVQHDLLRLHAQVTIGVPIESRSATHMNPKRMQRAIRRAIAADGIPDKAFEAMRLQIEQHKIERRQISKAERDAERSHQREMAHAKARARHRGH